ncbi:MLP-like protein 423 isoform X2 [Prosopis cineraria]|uniref:MLP-like protein 423 isoform X2 n=1 Tax=Prosopis cineraria TaxID=364024 RepID=UPI00240ECEE9|nr:MLP-like protein 423 isoform X2 [Prosopis cineraria]
MLTSSGLPLKTLQLSSPRPSLRTIRALKSLRVMASLLVLSAIPPTVTERSCLSMYYLAGSPIVKTSKERIDTLDDAKKTLSYTVIEGDLLMYFKLFKAHMSLEPKGDGTLVKWWCEYEKASHEVPDPDVIKEFALKNFHEVDAYIQKA